MRTQHRRLRLRQKRYRGNSWLLMHKSADSGSAFLQKLRKEISTRIKEKRSRKAPCMISVMPVPLLAAHPREYNPQGRTRYVPSACACRWTYPVHLHRPPWQALWGHRGVSSVTVLFLFTRWTNCSIFSACCSCSWICYCRPLTSALRSFCSSV